MTSLCSSIRRVATGNVLLPILLFGHGTNASKAKLLDALHVVRYMYI
jgi:hypothetical protein